MAQKIDLDNDDWNVIFTKGDKSYRVDSLIYSSLVMDRVKENEEPSKDVVVQMMKESMDHHDGLSDNEIWSMSVRLAKAMQRAGNA
jgi:predicted Zn-dependent protease with MMP-like domain